MSLSWLFGGGGNSGYGAKRDAAASRLTADRNSLDPYAAGAGSTYNYANPNLMTEARHTADYLRSDPYTDSYSARKIAQSTAGNEAAFQAAQANLSSDLAQRGLSDSSMATGGNAAIAAARASAAAQARGNLATDAIADRERRQMALLQLFQGLQGNALQQILGIRGAQGGMDSNVASIYSQADEAEKARQAQQQAALLGLFGAAGQGIGAYYGARGR